MIERFRSLLSKHPLLLPYIAVTVTIVLFLQVWQMTR